MDSGVTRGLTDSGPTRRITDPTGKTSDVTSYRSGEVTPLVVSKMLYRVGQWPGGRSDGCGDTEAPGALLPTK